MAELTRIQQQAYDCVREHNDPKGLNSNYYYYMYCCAGNKDVHSQEAFEELLEELLEEGLLKEAGRGEKDEKLYCLAAEETAPVSRELCPAFVELQREFQTTGSVKLAETAKEAMLKFIPNCGIKNSSGAVQALVLAASIGTEGKSPLNPPEKALVNSTFGALVSNSMELIYHMMEQPLDEQAFGMMTVFSNVGGRDAGMSLLRFILAYAYADGDLSEEVAARLEAVFRPLLEKEKKEEKEDK